MIQDCSGALKRFLHLHLLCGSYSRIEGVAYGHYTSRQARRAASGEAWFHGVHVSDVYDAAAVFSR